MHTYIIIAMQVHQNTGNKSMLHKKHRYNRALEIIGCGGIETTLRTRRLLWAGALIRMGGGLLPKRIVFGNLEGAVRRGRGGKEEDIGKRRRWSLRCGLDGHEGWAEVHGRMEEIRGRRG